MSGTYSQPLTIAAANDVIVRPTSAAQPDRREHQRSRAATTRRSGLIANNFVRVAHRVSSDCGTNLTPVLSNVTIEAAILSLQHSFIVDNYHCGTAMTKLTVTGAIVQKYRGPVGTGSRGEHRDGLRQELLVRRPLPLPLARRTSSRPTTPPGTPCATHEVLK